MVPAVIRRSTARTLAFVAASCCIARADPPAVCVETIDGRTQSGQLAEWTSDKPLRLIGPGATSQPVAADEISRIAILKPQPAERTVHWRVITIDGQQCYGDIERAADDRIVVRNTLLGPLEWSLDSIRRIELATDSRSLPRAAPESDRIRLANGDVAEGIIEQTTPEGLVIQATDGGESRTLEWNVIESVDFANPQTAPPEVSAALLRLIDGSCLRAARIDWKPDGVVAVLPGDQTLRVPAASLRSIELPGKRRVWLSELDPIAFEHLPKLGPTFELGRDTACDGRPLRADGRPYDRGLGLHSACRVEWKLDRRFKRLVAAVAIDDSAGPLADATLRILLDGREVARFDHLRHRQRPRRIGLDLSNADSLLFEVDYGENADVQDRVDLLDAALIRN